MSKGAGREEAGRMEEGSKGGGRKGVVEGVGMREGGMEVDNGENEGGGRRDEER